ncbi:hypothetical protein LIER_17585 [Lithospermum erythrorhizon]|uniref:Uncharacterized protein n=1 Tax=Lithospermum erythrorhizon TaxID=34254 RepID=A0AAV3QDM1_LITER
MACCFSCKSSSSYPLFKNIRVVHLNGYLEEFDHPLEVSEVTGNPSKHFIFTYVQLVSSGSEHLKLDDILEPGKFYFMIPYSTFQEASSFDLVPIARRLAAIAKKGHCKGKEKPKKKIPSPSKSCANRFSERGMKVHSLEESLEHFGKNSWKPVLSTIREMSFNKRSESDLQDKF